MHAAALRDFFPDAQHREEILADMLAIAEADGRTSDVEQALITLLREQLGPG